MEIRFIYDTDIGTIRGDILICVIKMLKALMEKLSNMKIT